ncbi:MAG: glycosyltransferase family 39 protein [Planctomycetes bacterium]|nr:glycosyltransferase family 39 protein [Planctomycetota bacterium]
MPAVRVIVARAAILLAAMWVVVFLGIALSRVGHPFELEWMGGAFVDHVCRVLDGHALYVEPTERFVPFLYGPLYFYACAAVSAVVGEGFLPCRLVSIGATLATFVLLGTLARRMAPAAGRTGIALAIGTYAAGYPVVDTWYDLTRTDSLFVALTAATILALESCRRPRGAVGAAMLLVLAYLTKQTALLLAPPFAVALLLRAPRLGVWFAIAFAVTMLTVNGVLDGLHDGWYLFYTFTLPRRHGYDWSLFAGFWLQDLLPLYPVCLAGLWWFGASALRAGSTRTTLSRGAWALGALLAALSSRLHVGGAINVLMPGILALALLAPFAWAEAVRRGPFVTRVVGVLLLVQLAITWVEFGNESDPHPPRLFRPARYVPTATDRAAGERLVALLRDADGDVLVPLHGYLPRLAGKPPGAHAMALIDIQRSGEPELWARLEKQFFDSARDRRADLVVLDEGIEHFGRLVVPGYRVEGLLFEPGERTFLPVVGLPTRPNVRFRRAP